MDMKSLYQEIIVDHHKRPRNFHKMEDATHTAEGFNPLCGDQLTLYVKIEDGKIADVSFEGSGCAISVASASMLTEAIVGKSAEEAGALFERMRALFTGEDDSNLEALGKLAALAGVRAFPSRIKCANLSWHALHAALDEEAGSSATASTE